jgi:hypothetical protein
MIKWNSIANLKNMVAVSEGEHSKWHRVYIYRYLPKISLNKYSHKDVYCNLYNCSLPNGYKVQRTHMSIQRWLCKHMTVHTQWRKAIQGNYRCALQCRRTLRSTWETEDTAKDDVWCSGLQLYIFKYSFVLVLVFFLRVSDHIHFVSFFTFLKCSLWVKLHLCSRSLNIRKLPFCAIITKTGRCLVSP